MGRPRSERSRDAILDAALALLDTRGYAGFAIEAVAAAAGAGAGPGKTTIYRWWKSKAELAVDAFVHATEPGLRFPDLGSPDAAARRARARAGGDARRRAHRLGTRARARREVAGAAPPLGLARMIRAKEAGESRPGVEPPAALAVLYGPLYTPLLFGSEVPSANEVTAYLDIACVGIFGIPDRSP